MNNTDNEDRALQALTEGALREQVLKTCSHCGITNQDLVQSECEEPNQRLIRSTLDWLSKPNAMGFAAMLEAMPMKLEGRKGRPMQAYLLTEFGRSVLNRLDPQIKARVNNPKDRKDLDHRFAQLDVLTRALQNGWRAEVERVIPYARGKEIRCDVLVHRPEKKLYIEIEQELTRSNMARAVEKFRHWQAYALSRDFIPDLVFVFNLPDAKLGPTLAIWQQALWTVFKGDNTCLDVRYILVGVLEGQPFNLSLDRYSVSMKPLDPTVPGEKSGAASRQPGQTAAPDAWLLDARELLPEFESCLYSYSKAHQPVDRLKTFFELMQCIHDASYKTDSYRNNDNAVYKYSELPVKSLWLLRHYLNLPQNQGMYEELKQALIWVQSRSNMGLIMLRNTITIILWDTFLKHHQFAMGGNLRVTLDVPDYVNHNSTFEVKVKFWDKTDIPELEIKSEKYCNALAWVMTAFIWYPEFLGTGTQPWKKKNNKKNGKG
jgi:hypothetical protein